MQTILKLNQFANKLANCRKLESSIINDLSHFLVCEHKLDSKLSKLAKNPAITTDSQKTKFAISTPHINVCVNPYGEFTAHMCLGVGCTALTQQEAL